MAQPKLLNLDDFTTAQKVVKLDGENHEIREMTVQEFIDKAAEARLNEEEAKNLPVQDQISKAVELVGDAFPTIPKERLAKLSLQQLAVLIDFVVKAPEQIEAEAKAAAKGNA